MATDDTATSETSAEHGGDTAVSPRLARIGRGLWWGMIVFCVAVAAETIIASLVTGESLKNVDYIVLVVVGVFLGSCVAARGLSYKLAMSLYVAGAVVVTIEAALTVASLSDGRAFAWYVWQPGYRCEVRPRGLVGVSERGVFSVNSRGIRGPEFSDDDRHRVLCVGGSTTECFYLDDEMAWPHLLSERLNARHEGVWVGNVGRSGATSFHHALLFEVLPEAEMVDTWLVLCGINDFGQMMRGSYTTDRREAWTYVFAYRRPGVGWPLRRPLHRNLFTVTMTVDLMRRLEVWMEGGDAAEFVDAEAVWIDRQRHKRSQAERTDDLPPLDDHLATYAGHIHRMIDLAEQRGKRIVFATQPTLFSAEMSEEAEALTVGGRLADGRYLSNAARARGMDRFNDRLKAVCAERGVPCIALAAALPRTRDVFYDGCHFNEPGAARVADELARHDILGDPSTR